MPSTLLPSVWCDSYGSAVTPTPPEPAQTSRARSRGGIHPPPMAWESGSNEPSATCGIAATRAPSGELLQIDLTGNFLPGTKSFPTISYNHPSSTFSTARAADTMFQQSRCLDHLQLWALAYLNAGEEQKLVFVTQTSSSTSRLTRAQLAPSNETPSSARVAAAEPCFAELPPAEHLEHVPA